MHGQQNIKISCSCFHFGACESMLLKVTGIMLPELTGVKYPRPQRQNFSNVIKRTDAGNVISGVRCCVNNICGH